MEGEKRKRGDDDVSEMMEGKKAKGEEVNGGQTVTEDEVEEFFAILRRIHVAVKYFEMGNGREERQVKGKRWRPCFELEDFEADNGVKDGGKRVEEDSGLDLNSDPAS